MPRPPVALVALALLGAGCALLPDADLAVDGEWQLVEGRGPAGVVDVPAGAVVSIRFDDGRLDGTAACNGYGGGYRLEGTTLVLEDVAVTEMGCEEPLMAAEQAYLAALANAEQVVDLDDERLVLAGPDTTLVFGVVAPPPTAALVDTRWLLDGLVRGAGPDGSVSSVMGDPYLRLLGDGTVEGNDGCNDLFGEWVDEGSTILLPTLGLTEADCPQLRQQTSQVAQVLGDGFTAEVDGQRLTLTDTRDPGLALTFRAP